MGKNKIQEITLNELTKLNENGYTFIPNQFDQNDIANNNSKQQRLLSISVCNEDNSKLITPHEAISFLKKKGFNVIGHYYTSNTSTPRPKFDIIFIQNF